MQQRTESFVRPYSFGARTRWLCMCVCLDWLEVWISRAAPPWRLSLCVYLFFAVLLTAVGWLVGCVRTPMLLQHLTWHFLIIGLWLSWTFIMTDSAKSKRFFFHIFFSLYIQFFYFESLNLHEKVFYMNKKKIREGELELDYSGVLAKMHNSLDRVFFSLLSSMINM